MSTTTKEITCPHNPSYRVVMTDYGFDLEGITGHGPATLGVVYGPNGLRASHAFVLQEGFIYTDRFTDYQQEKVPEPVMEWLRGDAGEQVKAFRAGVVQRELYSLWRSLSDVPVCSDGLIAEAFRDFPAGTCREVIWRWFEGEAAYHGARFNAAEAMVGVI